MKVEVGRMRVLAFLLLASAALAQAEVSSEEQFREGEIESALPGRRVRYVIAPVVRFSEQNRVRRVAVADQRRAAEVQLVGLGDPGGWNPWRPPNFLQPYEKKWPDGMKAGYCCQIQVPWSPGGGLPAGGRARGSEQLDPIGVDRDGDGVDDFFKARPGEANGGEGSGINQNVNYYSP